jgi:hypothetical protein
MHAELSMMCVITAHNYYRRCRYLMLRAWWWGIECDEFSLLNLIEFFIFLPFEIEQF